MERQRSFAVKPTRFLVFTFTISSFIIFLSFISLWIVKNSPARPESFLFFNRTPVAVSFFRPVNLQTVNSFGRNFSRTDANNTHLIDTHFRKSENLSAHLKNPENITGYGGISIPGEQRNENAAEEGKKDGGADGNTTAIRPSDGETSIKEVEVQLPISEMIKNKEVKIPLEKLESPKKIVRNESHRCDLTKGKWVFDESNPLYSNGSCPFIDEGFDCEGNGRLDLNYKKFKWQPQDCDDYRFNATKMLELIRGKRIVFVGDSINRNQWESMLCMLFSAIKDPRKVYETRGRRITKKKGNYSFKFVDYKCTVEFYVSHFLVHEDKARLGRRRIQTLRIDTIDRGSSRWRGADVLVFNSAHWWSHYKTKSGINYYQERDQVLPRLDVNIAFKRALTTWGAWVDKYINSKKTRVFFRSSAPSHFRGGQWNSGGHCREATEPLNVTSSNLGYPEKNVIVEDVISQMKTRVTLLNVTGLSDYRIDGHPSMYGKSVVNRQGSRGGEDCSHWCLPGVPDTWNELLYFHLNYNEMVK
ncbi:protein trichome birefringence-like 6 [Cucurbita moschata]|uniref:Protein trichome birefringence-like 6 n=1 Tax=Cucurbita moschata TaxID=3662 RepID=A0A6J1F1N8_CUCMO|nr:protein trichome birefringence-like 6 [Cucurbita moschata]